MSVITPKAFFLHVPKTGGSTVRKAIEKSGLHVEALRQQLWHPDIDAVWKWAEDRYSFGFVRHPVAWLRSRWAYSLSREPCHKKSLEQAAAEIRAKASNIFEKNMDADFSRFVEAILELKPNVVTSRTLGRLETKKRTVDFIGRTENLLDDTITALTNAGECFDAKRIRKTPKVKATASTSAWRKLTELPPDLEAAICENEPVLMERFYGETM